MSEKRTVIPADVKWQDTTPGGIIYDAGNAELFLTGDWRSARPIWIKENCKQCLLCYPVCPDTSILIDEDGKRKEFDFDHCKGCGVCAAVCPFKAITMESE